MIYEITTISKPIIISMFKLMIRFKLCFTLVKANGSGTFLKCGGHRTILHIIKAVQFTLSSLILFPFISQSCDLPFDSSQAPSPCSPIPYTELKHHEGFLLTNLHHFAHVPKTQNFISLFMYSFEPNHPLQM